MRRNITLQQYRNIDLLILLVLQSVSQAIIYKASTVWFADQLYVVSPVAAVTALVMMRWSGFGAIHAVTGGVLYALIAGGSWQQVLIYGGGNLLAAAALFPLKLLGKERIRGDALMTILFALCVQVLMQLGRGGIAAVLGYPGDICLGFITTDVLSGLFSMVILWCVRRIDGLFEDQKEYLLRLQHEQKVERGEQF